MPLPPMKRVLLKLSGEVLMGNQQFGIDPAFVAQRGQSWAVRVGPYVRRTEAEAQRQRLQTGQKLGDAMVVSHTD